MPEKPSETLFSNRRPVLRVKCSHSKTKRDTWLYPHLQREREKETERVCVCAYALVCVFNKQTLLLPKSFLHLGFYKSHMLFMLGFDI